MNHFARCSNRRGWGFVVLLAVFTPLAIAQKMASTSSPGSPSDNATAKSAEPAPQPEYIVGEGDVLHINVWKEAEISQTVVVRPDGNISLPLVNEVPVAGLTPRQIQELVTEKLKSILN